MEAITSRIKKVERVREETMDRISKLKKEIAMCVDELEMNEEVLKDIDTNLSNLKGEQVFLVKAMVVASAVKLLDSTLTDDDAYLYTVWEERIAQSQNFQEKLKYPKAWGVEVEKREEVPEKSYCDWCGYEEIDDECQCGVTICGGTALPMSACTCEECGNESEEEA